jgi:hypothetical protein
MDSKNIEDISSEKDLDEIKRLVSENSKYNKISKKQESLLGKLDIVENRFESKAKEYAKKFAQKKDVDFFKKRLAKYYGYMKYSTGSSIHVHATGIEIGDSRAHSRHFLTPYIFFIDWSRDNADRVNFSGASAAAYGYSYWTDIGGWAKFREKEKLNKKIGDLSNKIDILDKKLNSIIYSIIKSHFKKSYSADEYKEILDEIKKLLNGKSDKWNKDWTVIEKWRKIKAFRKQMVDITGGYFEYAKMARKLRNDMKSYYQKGVIPVLNSSGEVEPLITAEQMRDSLINLTFQKYEDQLGEYAKEFKANLKLYAEKYADSKIDMESDDDYEDESSDSDMDEDS